MSLGDLPAALIGFAIGVGLTANAAWYLGRRAVTRIRAAERRARSAERMAEIGAMTGGLAHEIKNPLSTIGLNAQLLGEQVDDLAAPDDQRQRLVNRVGVLRREADRLRGILEDFLQFAGQVRLDKRDVDVRLLVEDLVDFYTPEAERLGVRLRADVPGQPVNAHIDPKAIKQSLLNLVINATQAIANASPTPASGPASRSGSVSSPDHASTGPVHVGPKGDVIIRLATGKDPDGSDQAIIHVIDTGPGINPETLARIFTPYFTTKAGGSGLGLPTSRRLVEEHGGRVEVHSEPGRGSDFVIHLPVRADAATPPERPG